MTSRPRKRKPILNKPPMSARSFPYMESNKGTGSNSYGNNSYKKFPSKSVVTGISSSLGSVGSSSGSVTSRPKRMLTSKEINEKRANGIFFLFFL